ncbi:MAG: alpha/beta fold hydrolase [Halomonadaceae bacterium]|nr:MAG: alpha/beta fold hydrolase [Halomonadaceae bacterium]
MELQRQDVSFRVGGSDLAGWWYLPDNPVGSPAPCIIMAHGLGGTRDAGLEPYAQVFASAGFPVLLFDYRFFGASGGEPRQLISVRHQLADWAGAIAWARKQPTVDPSRVALWGSSFSGGHVIVAAARDRHIAAVSAQNPMTSGLAAVTNMVGYAGVGALLRLSGLALRDQIRGLSGRKPLYAPIVAAPGETAAMSSADAAAGYQAIAPANWRNELTARMALHLPLYRPIRYARRLKCPLLVIACMDDTVAPAFSAEATAARAGLKAELKRYDGMRHFDVYVGEGFRRSSEDQLDFFRRSLGSGSP